MLEDFLKYSDFVLTFIILPLIGWIWRTDRKTLALEIEFKSFKAVQSDLLTEFRTVITKLDEIKDEIHNSFVSQRSCDFRHKN